MDLQRANHRDQAHNPGNLVAQLPKENNGRHVDFQTERENIFSEKGTDSHKSNLFTSLKNLLQINS